jgi:hypothetical protein
VGGRLDDVQARLEAIAEELGDLALDRLRAAVDAGATKTPADERLITRARRSVEKAASLLEEAGSPQPGDEHPPTESHPPDPR